VRRLLDQYDAGHFDEFMFVASYAQSGFQYNGVHMIDATPHQFRSLVNTRIIQAEIFDMGDATCTLDEPQARRSVRALGAIKRERILHAIYDLNDGKATVRAKAGDIMKRARVDPPEFETALLTLSQEHLVSACSGDGGPLVYLEPAGIRRVESAGARSASVAAVNIGSIHLARSNLNIGDGNTINTQQGDGINAAQAIELLRAQSDNAIAHVQEIRELLAQIEADIKSGKAAGSGWAERMKKLAEAGTAMMGLGAAIEGLIKSFHG
jgi:hypothetical protein